MQNVDNLIKFTQIFWRDSIHYEQENKENKNKMTIKKERKELIRQCEEKGLE